MTRPVVAYTGKMCTYMIPHYLNDIQTEKWIMLKSNIMTAEKLTGHSLCD